MQRLREHAAGYDGQIDLAIVVADGLSALAVQRHTLPFLERLEEQALAEGWSLSPVVLVEQGRVAVADEIGELLRAKMSVILIGERPGLSSPDSLGLYFTWAPRSASPTPIATASPTSAWKASATAWPRTACST